MQAEIYRDHGVTGLKINGKDIKLKGEQRYGVHVKNKGTTEKIKIALKKGWKIDSVYGYYNNDKTGESKDIKDEKKLKNLVKSGKAISFPKKWDGRSA